MEFALLWVTSLSQPQINQTTSQEDDDVDMGDLKPDGFLDDCCKGLHTNIEDVPLAHMQTDPAESGNDSDYNANIDKGQHTNFKDMPLGQMDPAESGDVKALQGLDMLDVSMELWRQGFNDSMVRGFRWGREPKLDRRREETVDCKE